VMCSPLRTLSHWWVEKNNHQLICATSVATRGGAVLITGDNKNNKSTTALACIEKGMFFLGDDHIIVSPDTEPEVYSLYSTMTLNSNDLERFPGLSKFVIDPGKIKKDKEILLLHPAMKDQIKRKMPLKALIILRESDNNQGTLYSIPNWSLQAKMSFKTETQMPNASIRTHDFIRHLCDNLPTFDLRQGSEIFNIPAIIEALLEKSYPGQSPEDIKETENKPKPLISIIVPVYNGEEFIQEAIDSILLQNYPSLEIVIVNDGSTDNSESIIKSLNVNLKYIYQENAGPAAARNRGICESSGEFIAFLDIDDFWPEFNLDLLVREILDEPGIQVVHGYAQLLKKNESTGEWEFTANPKESFPGYIGAGLYRKSVFEEVGLFDPALSFGEDSDWFNRANEMRINLKKLEAVTLYVRRHRKNMTQGKNLKELNVLRVFKKSLDRIRNQKLQ
jgi:GT2 family glycosyltransferase